MVAPDPLERRMSAVEYDQDEEEMPQKVGIITGGASGKLQEDTKDWTDLSKASDWPWHMISHKRDGSWRSLI